MVSSLLHVLIVTPVILTWLRERALSRKETTPSAQGGELTKRLGDEAPKMLSSRKIMAGATGLEPAASFETGQRAMVDLLERRALVPD
jgi:hypothetical protein